MCISLSLSTTQLYSCIFIWFDSWIFLFCFVFFSEMIVKFTSIIYDQKEL